MVQRVSTAEQAQTKERARSGSSHIVADAVLKATGTDTVTVACKLPNGLWLQIYEMVDAFEMTPMGRKSCKESRKKGLPFRLHGAAVPFAVSPVCQITAGFALTPGVPRDLWETWLEQNAESDLVKNRLIWAHAKSDTIHALAQECREDKVKSGMEPIDPKNPPKVGLGMKITTADKK